MNEEALPAVIEKPLTQDLIDQIALDIGKEVAHYIETMYPGRVKNKSMLISIRNKVFNEINAAIQVTEEGQIVARIQKRAKLRRHMNKLRKIQKDASPENSEATFEKLEQAHKDFNKIMNGY